MLDKTKAEKVTSDLEQEKASLSTERFRKEGRRLGKRFV